MFAAQMFVSVFLDFFVPIIPGETKALNRL